MLIQAKKPAHGEVNLFHVSATANRKLALAGQGDLGTAVRVLVHSDQQEGLSTCRAEE